MDKKNRRKILVVIPYGMCFRNVVLNNTLWSYLTGNFIIDIATPLIINQRDKRIIRVNRIYNYNNKKYKLFYKILISLNARIHHIEQFMDLSDFFLKNGLGWPLVSRYHDSYRGREDLTKNLFFWPAIKRTCIGKLLKRIIRFFPLFHPFNRTLKKNNYDFIIITHNSEYQCVIIAQIANKLKIPVVCIPLGLDNILHGPILFFPDLMLLWGNEQKHEFEKIQIPWNEKLSRTKIEIVGCVIYDNYLNSDNDKQYFYNLYNIKQNEKIILFTAHIEHTHPGHIDICETIIKFIKDNSLKARLLVRLRPGFDVEMWKRFQQDNINYVILQIPKGVSFDKSLKAQKIDIEKEIEEIRIFSASFTNSSIVVTRALSTTYTDSLALATPCIVVQYYKKDRHRMDAFKNYFAQVSTFYPYWNIINMAYNEEKFIQFLQRSLIDEENVNIDDNNRKLLYNQVFSLDGNAGQRAVDAIINYFNPK